MRYNFKLRLGLFLTVFGILMGAYAYRLIQLQVVNPRTNSGSTGTYTYDTRVTAARGEILDRNGNVLVTNRASYNLIITGYALFNSEDPNESLRQLASLCRELEISYSDHLPVTRVKPYEYETSNYSDTWNNYFRSFLRQNDWDADVSAAQLIKLMRSRFHIPNDWSDEDVRDVLGLRYELDLRNYSSLPTYTLLSDVDATQLAELMELNTPGMQVLASTVREYNTTCAAHILGRTAAMSPEEWEVYKEKGYAMDAFVGKDGLEKAFEDQLHGTDGVLRTTVDREGNIIAQYYAVEPKAGANVETTIDVNFQRVAEEALGNYILDLRENGVGSKQEGKDAEGGAVVVVDVKTGAVLASASYPTFNIATFSQDYNELIQDKYSPIFNRALMQAYPPGSIYKMCTSIAALNDGIISRNFTVEDKGIYEYYKDYQPACYLWTSSKQTHGIINCAQALAVSCNYFFYEVGRLTGMERMDKTAKALGLGEPTGVELPETTGWRANEESKKALYSDPKMQVFTDGDIIAMAIGQSENRFSPLQMAVYTAAVANRGVRYKATFLNRIISADYQELIYEMKPEVASVLTVTEESWNVCERGMRMAVADPSGTANKVFGEYPVAVCAKTGTAQHGPGGSDHASFVCYAPADDPQIAIAVYVEKGAQGGSLGNIAKAIFDAYFVNAGGNDTVSPENAMS
jgi:penicillin-binding protein 2